MDSGGSLAPADAPGLQRDSRAGEGVHTPPGEAVQPRTTPPQAPAYYGGTPHQQANLGPYLATSILHVPTGQQPASTWPNVAGMP